MSITRHLRRAVQLCAIACALLVPATSGAAFAAADPLLAQERYLASYGTPDPSSALAQERYLSSYGAPEPLTPPQTPAPSNHMPWLTIALSITGALVVAVAASANQARRVRIRRRRAAHTPA